MSFGWLLSLAALLLLAFLFYEFGGVAPALAPFAALAALSLALLAFGLCNLLTAGTWLLWAAVCAGGGWAAVRRRQTFVRFLLAPGVLAFAAGSLVIGAIAALHGSFYSQWDEYSHWGPFFKLLYENGRLHLWYDANVFHPSYPQAVQVFYYFVSRFAGAFRESDTFAAMGFYYSAAAAVLLHGLDWKKPLRSVLGICWAPLFFILFPAAWPYITVYQDALLGGVFGAAAVCALAVRVPQAAASDGGTKGAAARGCWLPAALGCTLLTQIKANGYLFALIVLALYLLMLLVPPTAEKRRLRAQLAENLRSRAVWRCFAAAAVPAAGYKLAWNLLLRVSGSAADQFSASRRGGFMPQLIAVLQGKNAFGASVLERFGINLRYMPVVYNGYGTSAVMALALSAGGLVLGVWLWRRRGARGVSASLWSMPVFFAAYLLMLIVTYFCYMRDEEALTNASSDRYLTTFFIGWVMLALGAVLQYGEGFFPRRPALLPLAASVCVLALEVNLAVQHDALNLRFTRSDAGRTGFDAVSAQMGEQLTAQDDVWVLCEGDDGLYRYMYHYTLLPARVSLTLPEQASDGLPQTQAAFAEMVRASGADYVVAYVVSDDFVHGCGGAFSDHLAYVQAKQLPCLYRVEADGTLTLVVQTQVPEP